MVGKKTAVEPMLRFVKIFPNIAKTHAHQLNAAGEAYLPVPKPSRSTSEALIFVLLSEKPTRSRRHVTLPHLKVFFMLSAIKPASAPAAGSTWIVTVATFDVLFPSDTVKVNESVPLESVVRPVRQGGREGAVELSVERLRLDIELERVPHLDPMPREGRTLPGCPHSC